MNDLDTVLVGLETNFKAVLDRKQQERDAEVALDIINEYKRTKDTLERLEKIIERLKTENVSDVMREYRSTGYDTGVEKNTYSLGAVGRY